MFFNTYPYTDGHELNLDWILAQILKLHKDWDEFTAVNTITNAGAWDITKQYQAWTIVSDNNKGYISLKPVPTGVAITNTEYWGLVADYDILVTDLSNRVSALEQGLTDLEDDVDPVITDYNFRTNRKMLFVGDSYSGTSHWSYKTGDLFGLTAGVSYWVNAVGGEGFTIGPGGNGFLDELIQFHNNASVPDDEITDIVVCGGANDAMDASQDIQQGISDFMDYAKANFPNATVYLGFIGAILNGGSEAGTRTQELLQRACFMYSAIVNHGGRYLAGLEFTLHKFPGMLDAGGLHPTPTAGDSIAKSVYNAMNGLNPINEWVRQDVVCTPQLGSDTTKTLLRCNYGEMASLSTTTNTISIAPGASTTFEAGGTGTLVYKLSNIYFNKLYIISNVTAYAFGVGGVVVDILFLEDGMYIRSNQISGGGFDNLTTTQLIVRNFILQIPLLDIM